MSEKIWKQFERCEICRWARPIPEEYQKMVSDFISNRIREKTPEYAWQLEIGMESEMCGTTWFSCGNKRVFTLEGSSCGLFENKEAIEELKALCKKLLEKDSK